MCQQKNNIPLTESHTLLSAVYTAEFYRAGGNEDKSLAPAANSKPMTVTKIFNASIPSKGATPTDIAPTILSAFDPIKSGILTLDNNEKKHSWKCFSCNEQNASQYCSSIVGKQTKTNVIEFKEKILIICNNKHCATRASQMRDSDLGVHQKYIVSDTGFRFSFRTAFHPLKAAPIQQPIQSAPVLLPESSVDETQNVKMATATIVVKDGKNKMPPREKSSVQRGDGSIERKRKHCATTDNTFVKEQHDNNENEENFETNYKKRRIDNEQSGDCGDVEASVSNVSVPCPTTTATIDTRADGTSENNIEQKHAPPPKKVYLKEFPFVFDGSGAWLCRHCLGLPQRNHHANNHNVFASHLPPPKTFIDNHLRACLGLGRQMPQIA
jgi:hypothetical protein